MTFSRLHSAKMQIKSLNEVNHGGEHHKIHGNQPLFMTSTLEDSDILRQRCAKVSRMEWGRSDLDLSGFFAFHRIRFPVVQKSQLV